MRNALASYFEPEGVEPVKAGAVESLSAQHDQRVAAALANFSRGAAALERQLRAALNAPDSKSRSYEVQRLETFAHNVGHGILYIQH